MIPFAATKAYEDLDFELYSENSLLFLFGSVDSLLKAKDQLFEEINNFPFYTYINIGLESADPQTLKFLGKPLSKSRVEEAFKKMMDINANYGNIEIQRT